jgi:hypothetical protein
MDLETPCDVLISLRKQKPPRQKAHIVQLTRENQLLLPRAIHTNQGSR